MGVIKSLNKTSEEAIDLSQVYVKKSQEYFKLKIFQQLTCTLSMFFKIAIIGSLSFLAIIFFAVGGTIALAQELGNTIMACSIIAGVLSIMAFISYLLRAKIEAFIIKITAKNFFD